MTGRDSSSQPAIHVHVIDGPRGDPYRDRVVATYDDPPEMWQKALGSEQLLFQFGLFDADELARGPRPGSVATSELRHFDRQLELAGLTGAERPPLRRILDLGCGWGFLSRYLARRFPECRRLDAVNISPRQLDHCARRLAREGLADRVNLFLCNGQDVDLLPDPEIRYDLVVIRGVYTHFRHDVFEASVRAVAERVAPGGTVLISDTLYKTGVPGHVSASADPADRLACGNRKAPGYFTRVVEDRGLTLRDVRVLPSNAEVIHWFGTVRRNIDTHFPAGVTGPIGELRAMAAAFPAKLADDQASVYSVVARRPG